MTIHELKCWPPFCAQIARGEKRFEIRRDDRGYEVGDMLHLREWDPAEVPVSPLETLTSPTDGTYTGRHVAVKVIHLVRAADYPEGIRAGFVVMSLERYRTWAEGQPGAGDWSEDRIAVTLP